MRGPYDVDPYHYESLTTAYTNLGAFFPQTIHNEANKSCFSMYQPTRNFGVSPNHHKATVTTRSKSIFPSPSLTVGLFFRGNNDNNLLSSQARLATISISLLNMKLILPVVGSLVFTQDAARNAHGISTVCLFKCTLFLNNQCWVTCTFHILASRGCTVYSTHFALLLILSFSSVVLSASVKSMTIETKTESPSHH